MDKELQQNMLILTNSYSFGQAIALLAKTGKNFLLITDGNNELKGYVDVHTLRRLVLSGVSQNEKLFDHEFESASIHHSKFENENYLLKFLEDNLESKFPFIVVTDDKGGVLRALDKDEIINMTRLKRSIDKQSYDRRILIMGGAGYLGSVLTELLYKNSYNVRILDKFIYGHKSVEKFRNNKNVEIIEGDIRNIETIIKSLEDVDDVILLAAVVGDPASQIRPSQTVQTNYLATQVVASACKEGAINRFIYASTCSVYGFGTDFVDENSPMYPVSLYARTKIASEKSIISLADEYFSPTILRMATLYGYSPRMRFDLVVNTMTLKAFQEKNIVVFGGNQYRPLLHVQDAANAFLKVLEANINDIKNKIFNVGSDIQNYQIKDLAKLISESLDGIPIKTEDTLFDQRNYKVLFDKIQNELGYSVEHTVEEAVNDIYQKLKSNEITNPHYKVYYNHFFDFAEEM